MIRIALRTLLILLAGALVLVLGGVLALRLGAATWAVNLALREINPFPGTRLEAKKAVGNGFSWLEVRGLRLTSSGGEVPLSVANARIRYDPGEPAHQPDRHLRAAPDRAPPADPAATRLVVGHPQASGSEAQIPRLVREKAQHSSDPTDGRHRPGPASGPIPGLAHRLPRGGGISDRARPPVFPGSRAVTSRLSRSPLPGLEIRSRWRGCSHAACKRHHPSGGVSAQRCLAGKWCRSGTRSTHPPQQLSAGIPHSG